MRDGVRGRGEGGVTGASTAAAVALRCASLLRGGVTANRSVELVAAEAGSSPELAWEARASPRLPRASPRRSSAARASAGVPPDAAGTRARANVGGPSAPGAAGTEFEGAAARIAAGTPVAEALAECAAPEWRVLAIAWRLAEQSGAPLAPALQRIGAALRALEQLRERRAVLLSGPRATVRLVSALPPLALLLGALLGFDPVPVLLSPLGVALLGAGVLLLTAGIAWCRALLRNLERQDCVAGLELELAWIALGGGAPPGSALLRTVDAVDAFGAEWVPFSAFERSQLLATTIAASTGTGAPLRPLLLEEAAAARTRAQAELEQEAERMGVRVLVPLGVCVLPAFIVLGVVPVLIAMLGG
ncbi:type II secretion system F family protein [Leucobacter sp. UCD-THU]|uniref:type II secretion system F family protein n=1 Tax=Leucobacter sp. UCD-THU TaxID=1292023 RepID=UPI0003624732|nr:type II secretion system F family protein [Leucobacter sp. UCD-THU]